MTFKKQYDYLISDNKSGSGELLEKLLNLLITDLSDNTGYSQKDFKEKIIQLKKHFTSFAIFYHFFNEFLVFIEKPRSEFNNKAIEFLNEYLRQNARIKTLLINNVIRQIDFKGKTILLHSNSSIIQAVFKYLATRNTFPLVYQTVSYPAREGILQANSLATKGFKVILINETSLSLYIDKIDYILFGADNIASDFFINKIGTYFIALLAQKKNIKVFVIADTRKMVPVTQEKSLQDSLKEPCRPIEELSDVSNENITPLNFYFEKIPNNLITKFIFERDI